jgi:hypothetical protein
MIELKLSMRKMRSFGLMGVLDYRADIRTGPTDPVVFVLLEMDKLTSREFSASWPSTATMDGPFSNGNAA